MNRKTLLIVGGSLVVAAFLLGFVRRSRARFTRNRIAAAVLWTGNGQLGHCVAEGDPFLRVQGYWNSAWKRSTRLTTLSSLARNSVVGNFNDSTFGQVINAMSPRLMQAALKFHF